MRLFLINQLIAQAKAKNYTGVRTVKKFLSGKELQIALAKVAMEKDASSVNFLAGVMTTEEVNNALAVVNNNFLIPVIWGKRKPSQKNRFLRLFSLTKLANLT